MEELLGRRRYTLSTGTITVRRPRIRGLEERSESRHLPVFNVTNGVIHVNNMAAA